MPTFPAAGSGDLPERRRERAVEIVFDNLGDGVQHELSARAANIVRELIDAGLLIDDLGAMLDAMVSALGPSERLTAARTAHRQRLGIDTRGGPIEDRVAVVETRVDDIERTLQTIAEGFTR